MQPRQALGLVAREDGDGLDADALAALPRRHQQHNAVLGRRAARNLVVVAQRNLAAFDEHLLQAVDQRPKRQVLYGGCLVKYLHTGTGASKIY